MYSGRYYHTLESKGRVAVPVKFRGQLGERPILTRGLDGCLFLFSSQDWGKLMTTISSGTFTRQAQRDFSRLMANDAVELEYDDQGRILIPEYLRDRADLKKQLVFVGSVNAVELWDRQRYHDYMDQLSTRAEEIAEQFSDQKGGGNE